MTLSEITEALESNLYLDPSGRFQDAILKQLEIQEIKPDVNIISVRYTVPGSHVTKMMNVGDIDRVESFQNYIDIHYNGEVYTTKTTISDFMETISEKSRYFFRVHNRHIVNVLSIG